MKYCKEIIKEICEHIEQGSTQRDAAILSGIKESIFYDWLKDPRKVEFSESLKRAHAEYKKVLATTVKKASYKSWQAAAWLLERRYKEDYALRQELTGAEGNSIPISITKTYENKGNEQRFTDE